MADDLVESMRMKMSPEERAAADTRLKKMRMMPMPSDSLDAGPPKSSGTPTTPDAAAPADLTDNKLADILSSKKRAKSIDDTVANAVSGIAQPGGK